ncbi:AraC family transcriptional regulator [Bosea sp. 685]|uniref:AraC family transcriptional regulator n=1 Tax=Bosea sp. 685 TaxID=3080057 RepID=UPI0028933394|nr:AraC family transcriptional regulator [Bosea sp. 685]WNJ92930.1 AraC family transcriptional regulator [Bosea sp. 685]
MTGRRQSALVDLWSKTGFAAALSDVTGPHLYDYGELPVATVAITLYDVRRHVLIEDGRVRRDGRVAAGRFRIGQPGRKVFVDAVPDVPSGKLLLLYLGDALLRDVGAGQGRSTPIELMDKAWDVDDPFLSLAAQRLVEASDAAHSGQSLLAEQLAYTLALHLSDRYAAPSSASGEHPRDLDAGMRMRIADFVRADPGRDIALSDMAKLSGLSPSAFIRSFKRSTGQTPHRFVVEQRVEAAGDLLRDSGMTIAEIALAVGFSSQSHLGTAFRTITGLSPAQFRRLKRGEE